jgi:hypothetical protein
MNRKVWLGGETGWSASERGRAGSIDDRCPWRGRGVRRDEIHGRFGPRAHGAEIGSIGAPRERAVVLDDIRLEDVVNEVRRLCHEEPQQADRGQRTQRSPGTVTSR